MAPSEASTSSKEQYDASKQKLTIPYVGATALIVTLPPT